MGEILIVPFTDVGWSPYFPVIAGLVTEIGGLLSHGRLLSLSRWLMHCLTLTIVQLQWCIFVASTDSVFYIFCCCSLQILKI